MIKTIGIFLEIVWAFTFLSGELILIFDVIMWSHKAKRKDYSKEFS